MTDKRSQNNMPTPKRLAMRDRRLRVLEMRKAGMSYRQIADAINMSVHTVVNDIKKSVMSSIKNADIELAVDLQRIEMALLPLVQGVRQGDHKSIDQWKQLIDTKHKLLSRSNNEPAREAMKDLPVKLISEVELEKI